MLEAYILAVEGWPEQRISSGSDFWPPHGAHDSPFGLRLTTLMIAKHIMDTAVPMSLLADHPRVHFHFYRGGIGTVQAEMH